MSDQAMKLFEALSHVDEELLERCDQEISRKGAVKYRLAGRHVRAVAACISLVVVGAAAWSGYRLVTGPCGASEGQSPAVLSDMAEPAAVAERNADEEYAERQPESGMSGGGMGSAAGAAQDIGAAENAAAGGRTESAFMPSVEEALPEAGQTPVLGAQSQMTADKADGTSSQGGRQESSSYAGNPAVEAEDLEEKLAEQYRMESEILDSRQMIPWEEACGMEPFSAYLPTALPTGYGALCARRSSHPDQWDNLIFKWSNGEDILSLDMTLGEVMTREDIERRDSLNEYLAEGFRKEMIPELQPAGEPVSFTLYYGDGMKIGFTGTVTADEMWEVVESVLK